MSKREIIQEVSGFYPLFEELLKDYDDLITPAVFGVAWRYCQMKDGVCKASLRKIADILNVSEATVIRRLETLCKDGYLIDTTPSARNVPHVYVDAGRVVMKSALGVAETVSHRNSTESVTRGKKTVSQGNETVSESQLIKESIKDSNKEEKDSFIQIIQGYAAFIFPDYITWNNIKRRLLKDDITLTGDEKKIIIAGLNEKPEGGQFTQAEIWQDNIAPYFAKFGLELEFTP